MTWFEKKPRQYAAEIMAVECKDERRRLFEKVPSHFKGLVRTHCEIAHGRRRCRPVNAAARQSWKDKEH